MHLQPSMSSEDIFRPRGISSSHYLKEEKFRSLLTKTTASSVTTEERRRTGRYVAGGAALAIIMIGVYHIFARSASTVAGICVPAIIMALYIVWVLYSIRRDRIRAVRLASAMHLVGLNDSSNISKITGSDIINYQKRPLDVI